MFDRILAVHPIVGNKDDYDSFRDFTTKAIEYKDQPFTITEKVAVGDDSICRDDVINKAVYGTVEECWIPLVFSAVDNPFSIDYGDIIWCPDQKYMINQLHKEVDNKIELLKEQVRRQYVDNSKKFELDTSRMDYISTVQQKMSLPPNIKSNNNEPDIKFNSDPNRKSDKIWIIV